MNRTPLLQGVVCANPLSSMSGKDKSKDKGSGTGSSKDKGKVGDKGEGNSDSDSGDNDKAKIQDEEGEEIMDNIKSFIEKLALPISEWEFTADNPENPYITIWFKGDDDSGKDDDKGSDDTVINYWNMKNYMPFFGRNIHDFENLRKKIGDEAATKIQGWWRRGNKKAKEGSDDKAKIQDKDIEFPIFFKPIAGQLYDR